MTNYYKILELKNFADINEIKTAHRKLSKRYHPDLNNGDIYCEEKFKVIQHAYEQLRNPLAKNMLDDQLRNHDGGYVNYAPPAEKPAGKFASFIKRVPISVFIMAGYFLYRVYLLDEPRNEFQQPTFQYFHADSISSMAPTLLKGIDDTVINRQRSSILQVDHHAFKVGSRMDEVSAIQGTPSNIIVEGTSERWYYGISAVDFKDSVVTGYYNVDENLRVKHTQ